MRNVIMVAAVALAGCQQPPTSIGQGAAADADRQQMRAEIADLQNRIAKVETVTKLTADRVQQIGATELKSNQPSPTARMLEGMKSDNTEKRLRALEGVQR